jgi:hypothetical protein
VFGLVTLLAVDSGGFALEKTLESARPGKTPRPRTAQHSTVNPRKRERVTVVEGGIKEAAPADMPAKVDDCPVLRPLRSQEGVGNGPTREPN